MPDQSTKLSSLIKVRPSGIRSIHVERDLQQPSLVSEYVFTAQARRTLARIVDGVADSAHARAWTLTGPYGSGKSYFGLFVMNLMGASQLAHAQALMELQKADPLLATRVQQLIGRNGARGLFPVPITGYRAPLQETLVRGLNQALQPLSSDTRMHQLLSDGPRIAGADSRALVVWLQDLLSVIAQPTLGYSGLLLLLDEMGKPLEHAAAHAANSDIYLLQELAEYASRSKQIPFVFMGILHQGFDRYAGNLDSGTQREWAKVQGRFEDISFQEPPDQQMRLLAGAIEHSDDQAMPAVRNHVSAYAHAAVASEWLPSGRRNSSGCVSTPIRCIQPLSWLYPTCSSGWLKTNAPSLLTWPLRNHLGSKSSCKATGRQKRFVYPISSITWLPTFRGGFTPRCVRARSPRLWNASTMGTVSVHWLPT